MGECKKKALRVQFDRSVKLEFHGAKITSDGGILVHRELDEVMSLTFMTDELLQDKRKGKNKQHTMTALMRQSTYGRLAGYEDTNDAERLRVDPAMRRVVEPKSDWRLWSARWGGLRPSC
jgi:hypothetical protein